MEEFTLNDGHRLTVLIVDNVPAVRQELGLLLQLAGNLVVIGEAGNGVDAIHQVDALHPDIVIMDLEMPIMDGYTATRRIKARYPGCRVIALTMYNGDAERQKAADAGADGFIVKGAALETLLQQVTES